MKLLGIILLSLFSQVRCGTLVKLESGENETEVDQQRSARVHRVADHEFLSNDDSRIKDTIKQLLPFGHEELEQLLTGFPHLNHLVQHEAQLFKELNAILINLVQEGIVTLRSMDLAISEMTNASSSPVNPKDNTEPKNLLEELEELDIYRQNSGGNESREDSSNCSKENPKTRKKFTLLFYSLLCVSLFPRGLSTPLINSTPEVESKATNIVETLDRVLLKIQNHLTFVRNIFHRLCRERRSTLPTRSSYLGKFLPMNQPKKVSIL